jgi:hypothetical protein
VNELSGRGAAVDGEARRAALVATIMKDETSVAETARDARR